MEDGGKLRWQTYSARHAMALYVAGDHDALSGYFLDHLALLREDVWSNLDQERVNFLNKFLGSFFHILVQEDYCIPEPRALSFLFYMPLISNLTAMSAYGKTDAWLEVLRFQQNNLLKILILLNPRATARFDAGQIFEAQPTWATFWYAKYFDSLCNGLLTGTVYGNALRQVDAANERMQYLGIGMSNFCFILSYFLIDREQHLKRLYHGLAKRVADTLGVTNIPRKKSIAIVTMRWVRTSAVYKSLSAYVESLKDDYDLTLVQLDGGHHSDFDPSWFRRICSVGVSDSKMDLDAVRQTDFELAYFPDVGMGCEDRFFANLRIAPIQVLGYGHPASTWGAQMDYFIGGDEVEIIAEAERNYSERLVTIPGIGAFTVIPPKVEVIVREHCGDRVVINCAWSASKFNAPHLDRLRRIAECCTRKVVFRFFVGVGLGVDNCLMPFYRDLLDALGEGRVELFQALPYGEYQRILAEGDFCLDSFPFGGFNTIVDGLAVGRPVVALEGHHACNRLASAVLRRVGFGELVATNDEDFVALALRLADDDQYRVRLSRALASVDLEEALCRKDEPKAFRRAIDLILDNHEKWAANGERGAVVVQ